MFNIHCLTVYTIFTVKTLKTINNKNLFVGIIYSEVKKESIQYVYYYVLPKIMIHIIKCKK